MLPAPDPRTGPALAAAFVRANTRLQVPPLVPEIRLHLASEGLPLWQAGEEELAEAGLPAPFWAFAWAGGQALARYLLDRPRAAAGKRVLDFAAGCGLAAIAAARAGAASVEASETDPFAAAAVALNAALDGAEVAVVEADLPVAAGSSGRSRWDLVLAGDVFYDRALGERVWPWLRRQAAGGADVLVGDPGRAYLPRRGLERVIACGARTSPALENADLERDDSRLGHIRRF